MISVRLARAITGHWIFSPWGGHEFGECKQGFKKRVTAMMPVTFGTQVAAAYNPDGAGRHLVYPGGRPGDGAAEPAVLCGADVDVAVDHVRAALAAMLRVARAEGSRLVAEARALLASLLEYRIALAAAQLDETDAAAVAAVRADRDEAIAVTAALLYWLPSGDQAWPDVALTVGRLSYDRYRDPWPGAEPPDPDDLDAACDLLLRAARRDQADEHTALYLVLALRDRHRLLACPADAIALTAWSERLLSFPGRGGPGRGGLPELSPVFSRADPVSDRADPAGRAAAWSIPRQG